MALNYYGKIMMANPARRDSAKQYLKQSEELAKRIPYWYDRIDSIHMPNFFLD